MKPTTTKQQKPKRTPNQRKTRDSDAIMRKVDAGVNKLITSEEKATQRFHALERRMLDTNTTNLGKQTAQGKLKPYKPKTSVLDLLSPAKVIPPMCVYSANISTNSNANSTQLMEASTGLPSGLVMQTGDPIVDAMFSGYASSMQRMPDPYTAVKTFTTSSRVTNTLAGIAPTSGTTTYRFAAFATMGSGASTYMVPTLTGVAGTVNCDWTTAAASGSWGINNISLLSRPLGHDISITFSFVGPAHAITLSCIPVIPRTLPFSSTPAGAQTDLSIAIDNFGTLLGGRVFNVNPGQKVDLHPMPLDNRSFDFEQSSVQRGAYDTLGQISWSGWCVWASGMFEGDRLIIQSTFGEECAYGNINAPFSYPATTNSPRPLIASVAKGLFGKLMDMGAGALKTATDFAVPNVYKYIHALVPDSLGTNVQSYTNFLQDGRALVQHYKAPSPKDSQLLFNPTNQLATDEKTDDQLEMITPKSARRPSLALSLSARKK